MFEQKYTINGIIIPIDTLLEHALEMRKYAYVPYSHFPVGAALMDGYGAIHSGANVENASYGLSICAERNAVFSAVAKGMKGIIAMCVVGNTDAPISPCGACRQVMNEFAHPDMIVILSNHKNDMKIMKMRDILPYSFGQKDL